MESQTQLTLFLTVGVVDVSGAWVCLCVVSDLNAVAAETLPRVNATVTVIHSASVSPG